MKNKNIKWLITDHNITVNFDGQTHIVSLEDALAKKLILALKEKRTEDIPELVSAAKRVEVSSNGNFTVRDGVIYVKGVEAPSALGKKIVKFANEGLPYDPLVKFAEKIQKNPSFRAVNELFTFLEKNDHPITEDGNFIAYKKVRSDFMDIYSGTFDNSVGNVVKMPRNQVNENMHETCSKGLHVANWSYANDHYGSHDDIMLEVEVNPENVVSVPVDYDNSKMRVCEYIVLGVVDKEHSTDTSIRYKSANNEEEVSEEDNYPFDEEYDDETEASFCS